MATQAQVEQFRRDAQALVRMASNDLAALWDALDKRDAAAVRQALEDYYPALVATYGEYAATLAAEFYDDVTPARVGRAVLSERVPEVQAQASARWAIGPLFAAEPNTSAALSNLGKATQRLVMTGARNTIEESSRYNRTLYARVPSGATTCAFCLMTASRGAVYGSARAAGDGRKYHDECDCVPTPMSGPEDFPEGYDPDELYEQYAAVHEVGATGKETTAAMRKAYGIS